MNISRIRKNALPWFGRFLELRLRAFVYALFALVGFMLGVMVHHNMAVEGIAQFRDATTAAIVRKYGR